MLGLIGKKVGMTQVFDNDGNVVPVTVVKVEPNIVVKKITEEKNGYNAVQLGTFKMKQNSIIKPYAGLFSEGIDPQNKLVEMRNFEKDCEIGDKLDVSLFDGVSFVDVQSFSKGKGYQGVMKRHGFRGGRKTHGSKFHRAPGSTGMAASPSRIFKGTKMPGRMGGVKNTVQNLELVDVNKVNLCLLIKGSIPGPKRSIVIVYKSKKKGHITLSKNRGTS